MVCDTRFPLPVLRAKFGESGRNYGQTDTLPRVEFRVLPADHAKQAEWKGGADTESCPHSRHGLFFVAEIYYVLHLLEIIRIKAEDQISDVADHREINQFRGSSGKLPELPRAFLLVIGMQAAQ